VNAHDISLQSDCGCDPEALVRKQMERMCLRLVERVAEMNDEEESAYSYQQGGLGGSYRRLDMACVVNLKSA